MTPVLTPRRRGLLRKVLLMVGAACVTLLVAEAVARVGGYHPSGARADIDALLRAFERPGAGLDEAAGRDGAADRMALHPYFAYDGRVGLRTSERMINELRTHDREQVFSILVLGGSVAQHFCRAQFGAIDVLRGLLKTHPRLAGRRLRIDCMARAGYKQPQQALALAYVLSCGAEPDVVINLDGFNELAIGATNPLLGFPTAWPSANHWAQLTRGAELPPVAVKGIVAMHVAQEEAHTLVSLAERFSLYRSALFGRSLVARVRTLRGDWAHAHRIYADSVMSRVEPFLTTNERPSFEEALEAAAERWFDSSRVMQALCEARGITYLHLLQPALHIEGAKPMADEERELGFIDGAPNPRIVQGYPLLQARAAGLAATGEQIIDLTQLFANVEEPLYFDDVHFVRAGQVLLAERIAQELFARSER